MGKPTKEFKQFIVNERVIEGKTYVQIEREHRVLRGTAYQWVQKHKEGSLHIDKRKNKDQVKSIEKEYEFLKKSFALLKEIRTKPQE